jgi:hypothetical protein
MTRRYASLFFVALLRRSTKVRFTSPKPTKMSNTTAQGYGNPFIMATTSIGSTLHWPGSRAETF